MVDEADEDQNRVAELSGRVAPYVGFAALGLNNIGLLIKTSGTVTYAEAGFFYIDDGSRLEDGSGHVGVKVYGTVPVGEGEDPVGRFVAVTGISSCEKIGENIVRVIRTRGAGDVEMLD